MLIHLLISVIDILLLQLLGVNDVLGVKAKEQRCLQADLKRKFGLGIDKASNGR